MHSLSIIKLESSTVFCIFIADTKIIRNDTKLFTYAYDTAIVIHLKVLV